jgi:CubicO group peptidase (beta-lactamase class C family)
MRVLSLAAAILIAASVAAAQTARPVAAPAAKPAAQSETVTAPRDDAFDDAGVGDFDPPPPGFEPAAAETSTPVAEPPAGGGHFVEPGRLDAPSRLAALTPYLDGLAAAHLSDRYPPAMMIALATPTETLVRVYGYKDADKRLKADETTLFRIASISKTFIWVSVMMLVDEGKIDLNADVNTYLKRAKIKPAFGKPVTMNDLMAHRAGFEDTFGDFVEASGDKTFEESLIRHAPKRVAPPGERTSYSNWGSDLAAQIVADVSGVSYEEFVRTRILSSLGMNATVLHDPQSAAGKARNDPALDARTSAPHKLDQGAPKAIEHDGLDPTFAAGAMALNADDAARWMRMFLNNGAAGAGGARLLSMDAFARMRRRNFNDRPSAPDFAHGFMETEIAGAVTYGHGGTLTGFISDMRIAPSRNLGVFVVVNGAEGSRIPDQIARAVIERVAGADPYAAANPEKASDALVQSAKELAGTWRGVRRVESKFEKLFSLAGEAAIVPQADGSIVVTAGGASRRWYPLDKDNYSDLQRDVLHVYRDGAGKPLRISSSLGTNTLVRAPLLHSAQGFNLAATAATLFSMLVFVGAWRRQGRMVDTTGAGVALAWGQAGVALLWYGFLGALVAVTAIFSDASLTDLTAKGYPPTALRAVQIAAYAAAAGFLLNAIASYWVWTRSGWSVWRKLHHLLFALSGLFAVYVLFEWRLILAPMSTP